MVEKGKLTPINVNEQLSCLFILEAFMVSHIMRYDPFGLINNLVGKEIKRALGQPVTNGDHSVVEGSHWVPLVDIKEEPNQFVLYADIPGVDPAQIEVFMENGVLTIRGERETEDQKEGIECSRVERITGSFERRFTLPDTADPEKITAQGQYGVLKVMIPKREKAKAKKIAVVTQS